MARRRRRIVMVPGSVGSATPQVAGSSSTPSRETTRPGTRERGHADRQVRPARRQLGGALGGEGGALVVGTRRERLRLDEQLPRGGDLALRRPALREVEQRADAGLLRLARREPLAGRIDLAVLEELAAVAEQLLRRGIRARDARAREHGPPPSDATRSAPRPHGIATRASSASGA